MGLVRERIETFVLGDVEFMPALADMQPGVFYRSKRFETTKHLCACGCGLDVTAPLWWPDGKAAWSVTQDDPLTVEGSFKHRVGCRSHYVIQRGIVGFK